MVLFTPYINTPSQSFFDGASNNVAFDVDVVRSSPATFVIRHLDCALIIIHD